MHMSLVGRARILFKRYIHVHGTLLTSFEYLQALFSRAMEPLKMVGMMAFMMWMSGSQLHIFSIMTTLSGVYQPLVAILNSGSGAHVMLLYVTPKCSTLQSHHKRLNLISCRASDSMLLGLETVESLQQI